MTVEYVTQLRLQTRGDVTGRRMKSVAVQRAIDLMNELQRRITVLWLAGFTPAEISDMVDQPLFAVEGWIATADVMIGIELKKLRETYLIGYGRQGWIEM